MAFDFSRRKFLGFFVSTASATALPPVAWGETFACFPEIDDATGFADALKGLPIIDAHCHIFNAADIPAFQFAEKVVSFEHAHTKFQDDTKSNGNSLTPGQAVRVGIKGKKWFDKVLSFVRKEQPFLGVIVPKASPLIKARPIERLLLTPEYSHEAALIAANKLKPFQTAQQVEAFYLKSLAKNPSKHGSYLRQWALFSGTTWGSDATTRRQAVDAATLHLKTCNKAYTNDRFGEYSGSVRFLLALSRTRLENFLELRSTYAARVAPGVTVQAAFFAPAFVDLDFWLGGPYLGVVPAPTANDAGPVPKSFLTGTYGDLKPTLSAAETSGTVRRKRTTIGEQMALMRDMAQSYPGEVHPFFPFCPWRQVHHEFTNQTSSAPLEILKRSIEKSGVIGVKLYPAMGFRPWNNSLVEPDTRVRSDMFPKHLYENPKFDYLKGTAARNPQDRKWRFQLSEEFGRRLDQVLLSLYTFCLDCNLPIMTHAAPSNSAGGYDYLDRDIAGGALRHNLFAEKGSIEYWNRMLRSTDYMELRLNLGHSGFENPKWRADLLTGLKSYPNVYADISYFDQLLGSSIASDPCRYGKDGNSPIGTSMLSDRAIWQKLMYGSDWYMLVQEEHAQNYLNVIARTAHIVGKGNADRRMIVRSLLSGNAARFLGFNVFDKDSNYTRLVAFYKRMGTKSKAGIEGLRRVDAMAAIANETATG